MTSWGFGIVAGLLGVFGAIIASRALDAGMETFGFGLVVFAVLLTYWLMKDHFDQQEKNGR